MLQLRNRYQGHDSSANNGAREMEISLSDDKDDGELTSIGLVETSKIFVTQDIIFPWGDAVCQGVYINS